MDGTVVVANAPWRWQRRFVALTKAATEVLAADGGANHLARIGVRPLAVVGDLDSLGPDTRRWVGEERIVLRPDQEHSDLHKTLTFAFDERGAGRVTILAATGGRLDHALANLATLARFAGRGPVEMWDEHARIAAIRGTNRLVTRAGQTVSLFPVGRPAVSTRGLRWELAGQRLALDGLTSLSNVAEGPEIELEVAEGTLLAFLCEPEPD